jgi:transitional endoplasmic reticulum ATPase
MSVDANALHNLQDALRVSPHNVPLRMMFAESLQAKGRYVEAEQEFRTALSMDPSSDEAKLALADCFLKQLKDGPALVIVEELIKRPETPARAYLLHAKILRRQGDQARAAREYRKALDLDPTCADPELGQALGVAERSEDPDDEPSDLAVLGLDGRLRNDEPEEREDACDEVIAALEKPDISFEDVGGMEALKEEIRLKIIHPVRHPEIYKAYGKAAGGGILLYGPPGCGKTYLARATAGEVQAKFLAIGIHDVLDMWIGNSERNLHDIFEQARESKPCVLFFDEVDALGASRGDMKQSAGRQVINQFLSELDGIKGNNAGLLILAATNAPWHLDSAFRRPGRFDRIVFVPPPDASARGAILDILLKDKPLGEAIDTAKLAEQTAGFSGADLRNLVDLAVEAKLREALKGGGPKPLRQQDLTAALKSARPTTQEWFSTARNYALYSNQGGLYDDVLKYLG